MSKQRRRKKSNQFGFTKFCPYCGSPVILRDSNYVYRNSRDYGKMWVCQRFPACDSYVGCHPNTSLPLGRLANAELRKAKGKAHIAFDSIWKSGLMTRREAYFWLSAVMNIDQEHCHIGMFDIETCDRVVEVCNQQMSPPLFRSGKSSSAKFSRGYNRDK